MEERIKGLFGKRVRERRLALGLTQQELADRAGLHRSYIGQVELGRRNVTLKSAEKIARALHLDIVSLLK
jgi:transcriptional regulator with XRE-family HTH domain